MENTICLSICSAGPGWTNATGLHHIDHIPPSSLCPNTQSSPGKCVLKPSPPLANVSYYPVLPWQMSHPYHPAVSFPGRRSSGVCVCVCTVYQSIQSGSIKSTQRCVLWCFLVFVAASHSDQPISRFSACQTAVNLYYDCSKEMFVRLSVVFGAGFCSHPLVF